MSNLKWIYVSKGHYSSPDDKSDGTVHVLDSGTVFMTHPSRATKDITGSKADRYIASVQKKFHVRESARVEPEEKAAPNGKGVGKPSTKPKAKITKQQVSSSAKKAAKGAGKAVGLAREFASAVFGSEERAYDKSRTPRQKKTAKPKKLSKGASKVAKGAGKVIGTTRAFVTSVAESQQESDAARYATPPKKTAKPKKKRKKVVKQVNGARPTIVRKKAKPKRIIPVREPAHPLAYLLGGAQALPPASRKSTQKRKSSAVPGSYEAWLGL